MNEFIQQILNILTGGAVAENAHVMTAAGWKSEDGNWVQKPDKDTERLGENLTAIGEAAATAPTLVDDVGLVVKAVRHPVRAARATKQAAKDLWWFVKHPGAVHVYHGTRYPELQDLRDATPYSVSNVGVHVTPDKSISQKFSIGDNGHILEAWIPKHDMETIDLGYNDYNWLSNNYVLDARIPPNYLEGKGSPDLYMNLLRKYGANPIKIDNKIYTANRVRIPLLDETWPDIPVEARQLVNDLLPKTQHLNIFQAKKINKETADLFSNFGKQVIKYNNVYEGGTAYAVTNPNVFHIPGRYSLDMGKLLKYPLMYGYESAVDE